MGPPTVTAVPALSLHSPGTSLGSTGSLDIKDFMANNTSDSYNILSTSISLSSTDSLYSLGEIPCFNTISSGRAPSIRFTTMSILSTAEPVAFWMPKPIVIIPTPSRVKSMLMEPICVDKWAERTGLNAPPGHRPWEDAVADCDTSPSPPWVPEGSLFPPEALRAILRHRRSTLQDSSLNDNSELLADLLYPSNDVSSSGISNCDDEPTFFIGGSIQKQRTDGVVPAIGYDLGYLDMPSIMVSTSTAIVPISLESSQSLGPSPPLAIHRGHQLPAPLCLSPQGPPTSQEVKTEESLDSGLYPGIPTPFLGSPSTHNPTFEYPTNDTAAAMDLGTMCGNLRSMCPPLRTPDFFPPLPPLPPSSSAVASGSTEYATEIPSIDSGSDEWGAIDTFLSEFANRPLLEQDDVTDSTPETKPLRPIQRASATSSANQQDDSVFWANSPTLSDGSNSEPTSELATPQPTSNSTSKQQRRKTVIIETTDSIDRRRTRVTLDLSDLTDRDENIRDTEKPVPWEASPPSHFSFSPGAFSHSTPHSRPASSATLKPPARGILKVQKNVRFSIIPSMHEYDEDVSEKMNADAILEHERSPTPPPGGRRKSLQLSATTPGTHSLLSPEAGGPTKTKNRASFPKHPAVRSIVKATSPPTSPIAPTPILSTPKTPKTPKPSGRDNPLRAVNARQSLPTINTINSTVPPKKDSRNSVAAIKEEVGKPKKARAIAAVSLPPQPRNLKRVTMEEDANKSLIKPKVKAGTLTTSPPKSGKIVNIRSMLSNLKLRT